MATVIKNFGVGDRMVLILDGMEKDFKIVEIDGVIYKVNVVYEIENAISISGKGNFVGKTVLLK